MRLYLDDDLANPVLAQLLRNAGHDVLLPINVGLSGRHDAVHLRHTVQEARVLLSRNHVDYEELHFLVLDATGHHAGILMVHHENDRKRDLKRPGIVRAIAKLEASQAPVADQFIILNHWR